MAAKPKKAQIIDGKCIQFLSTPDYLHSTKEVLTKLLTKECARKDTDLTLIQASYILSVYQKGIEHFAELMEQRCKFGLLLTASPLCVSCTDVRRRACEGKEGFP